MSKDSIESNNLFGDGDHPSDSILSGPVKNPLDDFSDAELKHLLDTMELQYKRLKTENVLFTDYLETNEPFFTSRNVSSATGSILSYGRRMSVRSSRSLRITSSVTLTSILEDRGPKISIAQKKEMISRACEDLHAKQKLFEKRCKVIRRNLKGAFEEFATREYHIADARRTFEDVVVIRGVNPITQKIPAEKFLKFLENWLRNITLRIEKLRSKLGHLRVQNSKVSALLENRKELRKRVHAVDFEQLKIENGQFKEALAVKTVHYQTLKKIEGSASLVLSQHKNYILKQEQSYVRLLKLVEEKEHVSETMEKKCLEMNEELGKITLEYEKYNEWLRHWKAPSVLNYAKVKRDLADIEKAIKKWQRRIHIQDITMRASLLEMKHITGRTTIDYGWLEVPIE